jgi:MatE
MRAQTITLAAPSAATNPPNPAVAARTRLLLEGPILPTLMRLAAPNVLTLLAFAGVITFDGFFLGRIGTNALAGASLAFPWVMVVLQTTNSGMGLGVSSAVSRALGAGRRDWANDLVFHAFLLALTLGVIFSTVMLLGTPFLFRWMGGREEMLSDALSYSNVALGGAVFICVSNLLGNAVRGTGNMSLPASVLVCCVLVHIAISPVLIFGLGPLPALGPAGAGWRAPQQVLQRRGRQAVSAPLPLCAGSSGALGGTNVRGDQRGKPRGVATPDAPLGADPVDTRMPPFGCEAGPIACYIVMVV